MLIPGGIWNSDSQLGMIFLFPHGVLLNLGIILLHQNLGWHLGDTVQGYCCMFSTRDANEVSRGMWPTKTETLIGIFYCTKLSQTTDPILSGDILVSFVLLKKKNAVWVICKEGDFWLTILKAVKPNSKVQHLGRICVLHSSAAEGERAWENKRGLNSHTVPSWRPHSSILLH